MSYPEFIESLSTTHGPDRVVAWQDGDTLERMARKIWERATDLGWYWGGHMDYDNSHSPHPLTFHNAPTTEVDGVTHLRDDAAAELARRIAERYAGLLNRLARE